MGLGLKVHVHLVFAEAAVHVGRDRSLRLPVEDDLAVVEQDAAVAELPDRVHVVTDVEDGAPLLLRGLPHAGEAFLLKGHVADGEHLVHDDDLAAQVRGDGEGELDKHAGGVALDRRVDKIADLGEFNDLLHELVDLGAAHAEDRAVHIDVLPPGHLPVEAGADLKHRGDAAPELDLSLGRGGDAGDEL